MPQPEVAGRTIKATKIIKSERTLGREARANALPAQDAELNRRKRTKQGFSSEIIEPLFWINFQGKGTLSNLNGNARSASGVAK